jgi:hypothetical protein
MVILPQQDIILARGITFASIPITLDPLMASITFHAEQATAASWTSNLRVRLVLDVDGVEYVCEALLAPGNARHAVSRLGYSPPWGFMGQTDRTRRLGESRGLYTGQTILWACRTADTSTYLGKTFGERGIHCPTGFRLQQISAGRVLVYLRED